MVTKIVTPKITTPRERSPLLGWLLVILLAGGGGAGWWFQDELLALVPQLGITPNQESNGLRDKVAKQQARIQELELEGQKLRHEIAAIQTGGQVDQEAVKRVKAELKKAQDERLAMQEEITFLRGLVSEGNAKGGLWVRDMRLQKGDGDEVFRYRFTLAAVGKEQENVSGSVAVSVEGKSNGEAQSLTLKALTKEKTDALKMQFRHFQEFEGEWRLPKGFSPGAVVIEAKPDKEGLQPASKRFDWVITG